MGVKLFQFCVLLHYCAVSNLQNDIVASSQESREGQRSTQARSHCRPLNGQKGVLRLIIMLFYARNLRSKAVTKLQCCAQLHLK